MAVGNPNYDAILSTTLKKYTPRLEDNIFDDYPFLNTLKRADNIVKVDGGTHIVEPLLYAQNSTAGSYSGYDNIDTTPQEGITSAEYDWKEFAATVAISNLEEIKNAGVSRVIALLEAKVEQTEMSISDAFNVMLLSDGSGNGGKDWNGIKNFADATPATGAPGGIDASDALNSWWRNYAETTVEALALTRLNNSYNNVSKGKDVPTNGFTTQLLYEKYESLLQPQLRYSDNATADAGFLNLLFKSTPVVFDRDIDAGFWYWTNTKYLKLKVHTGTWFKPTPFVKPHGQTARYSQIICAGNLVCSNRARQAVLTGKS
jgi:hypothetical protein